MAHVFSAAFTEEQIAELDKPLAPHATSHRKGSAGKSLSYIEGHNAISTANRIFGYGNWGYKTLSIEQVVILDPISGEAVGIEYKATVEVSVRGALPITDVGSQPVAVVSIDEQCWARRAADARYNKKSVDESPLTDYERKQARAVIMEAHEQAKKAAVTDAMKRGLRAFGAQFGNDLYGPERAAQDATSERAASANGRSAGQQQRTGAPSQLVTVAEKLARSKQQAIERGLVEAAQWEQFKADKLGTAVADSDITAAHYGVIFNALKALQANAKQAS
jgi:recombination DNA repair RAD52 pathway protein